MLTSLGMLEVGRCRGTQLVHIPTCLSRQLLFPDTFFFTISAFKCTPTPSLLSALSARSVYDDYAKPS
jgi:hypothetical protein